MIKVGAKRKHTLVLENLGRSKVGNFILNEWKCIEVLSDLKCYNQVCIGGLTMDL